MYLIKTNVDGCITGDYYAELIQTKEEAEDLLQRIKEGDPEAEIYSVKEEAS